MTVCTHCNVRKKAEEMIKVSTASCTGTAATLATANIGWLSRIPAVTSSEKYHSRWGYLTVLLFCWSLQDWIFVQLVLTVLPFWKSLQDWILSNLQSWVRRKDFGELVLKGRGWEWATVWRAVNAESDMALMALHYLWGVFTCTTLQWLCVPCRTSCKKQQKIIGDYLC